MLAVKAVLVDEVELNVDIVQQVGCVLAILLQGWEHLQFCGQIELAYQHRGYLLDVVPEVNHQFRLLLPPYQLFRPLSLYLP